MTLIPTQIKCEHRHLYGVTELIAEIELEQWEEDVLKKSIYIDKAIKLNLERERKAFSE